MKCETKVPIILGELEPPKRGINSRPEKAARCRLYFFVLLAKQLFDISKGEQSLGRSRTSPSLNTLPVRRVLGNSKDLGSARRAGV